MARPGGAWLLLLIPGCAFHVANQSALKPASLRDTGQPINASISVRFLPEREGAVCGDTFQRFIAHLRQERIFAEVAVATQDEPVNSLLLEAQFNCRTDPHDTRNSVVAFLEGFGAFLPMLLSLHDVDVVVDASVTASRAGHVLRRYEATSHFDANAGYLGVVNHPERILEMAQQADAYTFRQLAHQFLADRPVFEAADPP